MVTWMVEAADSFLLNISEQTFGQIASGASVLFLLLATLALALVALNAVMQYRSVDMRTTIILMLKIALIQFFALDWYNFNTVASGVQGGIERLAGAVIGSVGGGSDASSLFFAGRFDRYLDHMQQVANAATDSMNWVGGAVWGVTAAMMIGGTAALAGAMLVFVRIMISIYISIAPIMILLSMFRVTSDYFEKWLAGLISYLMYPIIVAGVFSIVFGLTDAVMTQTGDPESATALGQLLPFIIMVMLTVVGIILIPLIIRQISGNFSLVTPMAAPMAAIGALSAARMAGLTRLPSATMSKGIAAASATRRAAVSTSSAAARAARAARLMK